MNFSTISHLDKREPADFLVVPVWEGTKQADGAGFSHAAVDLVLKSGDFKGKNGETAIVYAQNGKEPRILILGLGNREKVSSESLRRAYANAVRTAHAKRAKSLNLLIPEHSDSRRAEFLLGIGDGIFLANYAFTRLKHDTLKENPVILLDQVGFVGFGAEEVPLLERVKTIASGVYFVRELVNANADDVTPRMLAETALSLEKATPRLKTTVFDQKHLEKEKMGLLLAVGRASVNEPYLIQTSYWGNPHSKEHVILVGKGVTYDTGGLSLKPTDNMLTMKSDMAGAATVLGAVLTAASLGLKINATAVIPTAENCIGSKSYKLGDVYRSYSGKTVEVNNTDAEGRLILADALAYSVKNLNPTCIVDIASLTGSIIIALGEEISGLYSNDDSLAKDLIHSSEKTGESLWRMPLYPDYKESMRSEIGDLLNTGGRDAGAGKAALFLQEFIASDHPIPWAHIDFAGPSYISKPKYYNPIRGTGACLRLLVDFLERRSF